VSPGTAQAGIERALRDAAALSEDDVARAAAAMAERANRAGILDVAYGTVETPMGRLLVAATELGVVRIALPRESFDDVLERLAARVSPRVLELPSRVDDARRELDEYFAGRRREFDLALDWQLVRAPFTSNVLEGVRHVPFGEAITYGEAAAIAGNPRAFRAAGNALGSNPIPVVIPCHRVVRTGGALGGYGGGPEMKRFLLEHEGWLP
jgi:methylated-DNA-[protein]-cysteine S-methyltransferase